VARILVAEDDEALRSLIRRALTGAGHEVTVVANGAEALDKLARLKGAFDLLLAGIKMPVMDGVALARAVARDYPDVIIVVLMSGYAEERERAAGLEALIQGIVVKPFTVADIRFEVAAALAARRA
jgi:two-component system, cell cycle response regulator CpdR